MSRPVDLHMHTRHSDGALSPAELLFLVRKAKLSAFSVTDHDTIEGWRAMSGLITEDDPELIVGTELSVRVADSDVHLLAYLFDPVNSAFITALDDYQAKRKERGIEIVQRLQNLGLPITFEQVKETAGDGVIGRPHVAATLHRLGLVKQYEEAFYKYIGSSGPAYVPKQQLAPEEAMGLVHDAGGVVVLAHPAIGDMWRHVDTLSAAGLDGIETFHYSQSPADIKRAKHIAQHYRLIMSGGSDFHGRGTREGTIGSVPIPYECVESMKSRAMTYRSSQ